MGAIDPSDNGPAAAERSRMPTYERFTGLRNDVPAERLGPSDLVAADNVDLDDSGAVRLRTGYRKLIAGADVHSLWTPRDGGAAYFVDGTALYRVDDGAASATRLASGLTRGRPLSYWQHEGRVYHTNGAQCGVIEGGAVRSWGITPPPAPSLIVGPGSMQAGAYQVVYTYVAADGQESGCGAGIPITLDAGGGIAATLTPSADPRVTTCRIYCTTTNGTQLYWAGDVPNGVLALVISTGQDELQRPLLTQGCTPPDPGHLVAYHRGRMYVAIENRVHYSAPFALELFRPVDHLAFESRIRMIAPTLDGIYISDSTAVWWCAGGEPRQMDISQRHDSPAVEGTVVFRRGARIGQLPGQYAIPMWLSANGVVVGMPGGELEVLTNQYRFTAPARGAGMFRKQRETYQYVASFLGA